ncbi:hypothetical protein ACIRNI_15585 [Streptomyces sp. NPDC093546]|uniref:hypothetical protein n=1 Tax=Streptomyces sp. NPDC093546 TaxID=3366040 RepID=UPI0037FF652D
MRREDLPEPTESGLSTEDLAQPQPPPREESTGIPAFPGESTAPTSAERTEGAAEGSAAAETAPASGGAEEEEAPRLLTPENEESFRERWQGVQTQFVDDPREAVHKADALVADVMQQLASTFADHKKDLEAQWNRGEEADTEDLRRALRKYRSFFNRLLTT